MKLLHTGPGPPLRHHVSGGIFARYCLDLDIHGSFLGWLGFTGDASSITNITHLLEALKYVVEYPGSSSILLNRTTTITKVTGIAWSRWGSSRIKYLRW